jgi:hypothetical protein
MIGRSTCFAISLTWDYQLSSPLGIRAAHYILSKSPALGTSPNQYSRLDLPNDFFQSILLSTPSFFLTSSEIWFDFVPDFISESVFNQAVLIDKPEL